jgi:predicted O-methyltransferase YrrM
MTDWQAILGCSPADLCGRIYMTRPDWIEGYIAYDDAMYLFARALEADAPRLVEVGTASGFSTAFLATAADAMRRAGRIGDDFTVESYDIADRFYADPRHATGDATREMLEPELLEHVVFRNPATAQDVVREHEPDSLSFAFIDAAHTHPWPTLDLLTLLPTLRPGAEVLLHDINLPRIKPGDEAVWGAKHLFDGLDVEKKHDEVREPPNIGSVWIPEDKESLRQQLVALVDAYPWEATDIPDETLRAAVG